MHLLENRALLRAPQPSARALVTVQRSAELPENGDDVIGDYGHAPVCAVVGVDAAQQRAKRALEVDLQDADALLDRASDVVAGVAVVGEA